MAPAPGTAAPPRTSGGGKLGAVLTRKAGPLPVWGWGTLATGLAITYYVIKSRKSAAATAASATTAPADTTPPFIIQNYPAGNPSVSPPVTAPRPGGGKPDATRYTTKAGDTLESVAKRFHTDPGEILSLTIEQKSGFSSELMALISRGGMNVKLPAGRILYYDAGAVTSGRADKGPIPVDQPHPKRKRLPGHKPGKKGFGGTG